MNLSKDIKTNWDFEKTLGYKSIKDPKLKKGLALAKKESYKFINKWKKDS